MKELRLFDVAIKHRWEKDEKAKEATIASKDAISAATLAVRWQNVLHGRGTYDHGDVIKVEENLGCHAIVE